MQRILILGATSAIAQATARVYAARGGRIFLVGRSHERLLAIANDLQVRGAGAVDVFVADLTEQIRHSELLDAAAGTMGDIDIALIAHGMLPDQAECERSVDAALAAFEINATSTIALATLLAQRMEAAGHGTLAVISSVAGDRGRKSNYVYGAAKAAVSTFLSGLRQRVASRGVRVVTLKPGPVDTPMTAGFKKGLLWATPEQVATGIVRAVDRGSSVAYLPWFWRPIMWVIRQLPETVVGQLAP